MEDPFGINDEMEFTIFEYTDSGKKDKVPDYIKEMFHFDLGDIKKWK